MKKLITLLLILAGINIAKAQSAKNFDWDKLIGYLKNEDWAHANKLTDSVLQKIPKDAIDSDEAAIIRYMYIISESGLMNNGAVSKELAQKKVNGFIGRKVILPGHPISLKQAFNSVQLMNSKTDTLFITETNKAATDIFCFDYVVPDKAMDLADFTQSKGKVCSIRGQIKSIQVEGNILPRYKIIIEHAETAIESF